MAQEQAQSQAGGGIVDFIMPLLGERPKTLIPDAPRKLLKDWQWAVGIGGIFLFAMLMVIIRRQR